MKQKILDAIARHFRKSVTLEEAYRNYDLGGQATVLGNGRILKFK